MRNCWSVLGLLLITVPVFAQPTHSSSTQTLDVEGERNRIRAQRAREEAYYKREEATCYTRFAVNDCLVDVRSRRRQLLDTLRRQEFALIDAERRRRVVEQLERIRQKSKTLPDSP